MRSRKNVFRFLIIIMLFCFYSTFLGGVKSDKLIFSEIYLNYDNPSESWIEITNITNKNQVLEKFRLYHFKTDNLLSDSIKEEGGIIIGPGKSIIICANMEIFCSKWSEATNILEIHALASFRRGGYLALKAKGNTLTDFDGVPYGDQEVTIKFADKLSTKIVPFSNSNKSYTRIMDAESSSTEQDVFVESDTTPGIH